MTLIRCLLVAALSISPFAQAQVHFDSGSARLENPDVSTRNLGRRSLTPVRDVGRANRIRCRDGSRHIPRVCRRHGGLARG